MRIEAENYKIELTQKELWRIACNMSSSIKQSAKDHWVNHQGVFEKNTELERKITRDLFNSMGRVDMYEDMMREIKGIFERYNEKNKDK